MRRPRTTGGVGRPLEGADRTRLAAISLAVIATGAAIMLATRADEPAQPTPRPPVQTATPAPIEPAAPAEVAPPARLRRPNVARGRRVARRFLRDYLGFTYGRRAARRLPDATPALRGSLGRRPPRVRRAERRRRDRVELLQNERIEHDRLAFVALISDRVRRYSVEVQLERHGQRWIVTSVQG